MGDTPAATFPKSFGAALAWFEARAGITDSAKLSNLDMVKRFLEKAALDAAVGQVRVQKAPRMPVAALVALELAVSDTSLEEGLRVVVWSRLLKVYGVMRADDLQRLPPKEVVLGEAGLMGRLIRTKTSGAGKAISELRLFIPKTAFLANPRWLEEGHGLWEKLVWPERDYFLPRLASDMSVFVDRLATSSDLAGMWAKALTVLRVPSLEMGAWVLGPDLLLSENLVAAFTGHSERSTLPRLLAALGVPKGDRDPLGRWSARGSDEYVRTYRVLLKEAAAKIVRSMAGPSVYEKFDEDQVADNMGERLRARGLGEEIVAEQIAIFQVTSKNVCGLFGSLPAGREQPEEGQPVQALKMKTAAAETKEGQDKEEGDQALYVIAEGYRGTVARLHKRDGCYRGRGLCFKSYELVCGAPSPNSYTSVCRTCWPGGDPEWETEPAKEDSEAQVLDEESSSDSG